jgi:PKD repeat protein
MEYKKNLAILIITIGLIFLTFSNTTATISPDYVEYTKNAGDCYIEIKTVEIPGMEVDIIFAFDLTHSMGDILNEAQTNISQIMKSLNISYPGSSFNFGVISHMDYPASFIDFCGYTEIYGYSFYGDYAYSLDQPLTNNMSKINNTINSLSLGNGWDLPENYARIFYESYSDTNIGWRPDAEKFLVNFGDTYPHDCNLNESISSGTWSTGGDPGPDEEMYTSDDLDLLDVLATMSSSGITLIECHSSSSYLNYWENWTGITEGSINYTTPANFVNVVEEAISNKLFLTKVYGLHLNVTTDGFESWLNSVVPSSYSVVNRGESVTFEEIICVPIGTLPGVYEFNVNAVDADGVYYGTQTNNVTVTENEPPYAPINPDPEDDETDVDTSPSLSVYVSDPDGDDLTVSFYDDSDDLIGTDTAVASGSTASFTWSGLNYETTYSWYAVADDGENSAESSTWSFTTKEESTPPPPPPPQPKNNDPVAEAEAGAPYFGLIFEDITFDGSDSYDPDSDGSIVSWHWDFGDGDEAYGEIVTHNYSTPDTYKVTLTVEDDDGATDTDSVNIIVSIANSAPRNLILGGPLTCKQNKEYEYTASAIDSDDEDMLRYIFEWGDGTSTTSEVVDSGVTVTVIHNWTKYGIFKVKVTAQDNYSAFISDTITVLVDVIVVDGEITGLIIDEDGNDPFDIFNNSDTDIETAVELDSGSYLIDINNDDEWDYAYHPDLGLITYYEFVYYKYLPIYQAEKAAPGFEFIVLIAAIAFIAIALRRRKNN